MRSEYPCTDRNKRLEPRHVSRSHLLTDGNRVEVSRNEDRASMSDHSATGSGFDSWQTSRLCQDWTDRIHYELTTHRRQARLTRTTPATGRRSRRGWRKAVSVCRETSATK